VSAALAMGVGRVIPFVSPLGTLIEAGLVALTFLVSLVVTRELGKSDLAALTRVVRRRGGGGA
jgi:uncharacterized RDD family membrane protein YckC